MLELSALNCVVIDLFLLDKVRYSCGVCADEVDVDYLLMAKSVATSHLGIRRDCAIDLFFGWLLVVLFKDRHLCCLTVTGGSVFEICEIGE